MNPNRLFNHYGSSTGNPHAEAIDDIMELAMHYLTKYLEENDVCPRDAMGSCIMSVTNSMAAYTLKRASKIKKEEKKIVG